MNLTRRGFLGTTAFGLLSLSLTNLKMAAFAASGGDSGSPSGGGYEYRGWEDLYRDRWQWDRRVRSTHFVNCWYQAHCAWDVYVKDGIVWREEQAADYPRTNQDVPDFNPRGCQKGTCFSRRMYDPTRIKYPLKRLGSRGSGKWQRVTWDEALTAIADDMIDVMKEEGPERIVWSPGPLYTFGANVAGQARLTDILGNIVLDMNPEIGDGHHGAAVTFGKIIAERSADDYFYSDVILIWGSNPVYTQIPNMHFLLEARYRGAKLVAISPDYNASAIHADLWLSVRPGTDAALALAVAQVIVSEGLYDREFVQEQTDLPLLVREDNRKFLRQSDLKSGGSEEIVYYYDTRSSRISEVNQKSLALEGATPALEGSYEVETVEGKVKVRPVFAYLKEKLEEYTPEKASAMTGTSPALIRQLALMIGKAGAVTNVTNSNFSKYYHGNLMERAQILVFALCGHMGKRGSGYSAFPFLVHDGFDKFSMVSSMGWFGGAGLMARFGPQMLKLKLRGFTEEMIVYELARKQYAAGKWVSGTLFWNIHGGLIELSERANEWDPHLKRPAREYLEESLSKGWQRINPPRDKPPRIIFELGSNILRRVRGYPLIERELFPKLKQLVVLEWRMSSTALKSDYVLPVAGWYERTDHKWVTPLMPFIHGGERAVKSFEAKPEWEVCALLAKKIQQRAKERGILSYRDADGGERRLDNVYDRLTMDGQFTEDDEEKVARVLMQESTNLEGVEWETVKKKGYARFTGVGGSVVSIGNACDIKPNETVAPFTYHVEKKQPYPTLSRRIQFYIDHELYLELGEELPVHKDPPTAGGDYPLQLTGGHTRWSIHAAWRDDALMLRQQRGEPVMYMSVADAKERRIADGEEVEVKNDIAGFTIRAKISPSMQPGQVVIYHAWENYQFRKGEGFQNLIPSPINPVELAGGQFHLRPMSICLHPGQSDRDTRVEVRRLSGRA